MYATRASGCTASASRRRAACPAASSQSCVASSAIGVYSPRLDVRGNVVGGQHHPLADLRDVRRVHGHRHLHQVAVGGQPVDPDRDEEVVAAERPGHDGSTDRRRDRRGIDLAEPDGLGPHRGQARRRSARVTFQPRNRATNALAGPVPDLGGRADLLDRARRA